MASRASRDLGVLSMISECASGLLLVVVAPRVSPPSNGSPSSSQLGNTFAAYAYMSPNCASSGSIHAIAHSALDAGPKGCVVFFFTVSTCSMAMRAGMVGSSSIGASKKRSRIALHHSPPSLGAVWMGLAYAHSRAVVSSPSDVVLLDLFG
ncbi:hypothetical protein HBH74_219590 [Parastagonospora nodorum]|nr:hypothetical protein HBH74_219590 [Parastagonospora nodorum]KAH4915772.1 hypothetical protein HBH73_238960 [Parastagonospora nodorum]